MGLFTEREETQSCFGNWIARKANWIALIFSIFAWTLFVFFMGMIYAWDKYDRVKEVEIETRIIEYRLNDIVLGRDTMNVIKEAQIK